MLYADSGAIGVVEAKPKGHTLTGVETGSGENLDGLPKILPNYRLPLPSAYESTGEFSQFTNMLDPNARSRTVFTFHRPEQLIRLVKLEKQVRTKLREMPPLNTGNLWKTQVKSVQNRETSLAANHPRALIQMATGSGKTFTAVNFCYRLIKHAGARRILFLVDRNNLGEQTLNEFQQFISPPNGYKFTDEYIVQHLKKNTITQTANVCITTIQRLYSMLKGEPEFLEENEDGSLFETENTLLKEPLPVIFYAGRVKANVLFLDAKPAQEKPWTKTLWVYDLRTNMHFTQKTNPLQRADLDEFVDSYRPTKRHLRKLTWSETAPAGRWRSYDYEDLMKRDKVNLDIFWLKDKSLEDSDDLPASSRQCRWNASIGLRIRDGNGEPFIE